MGQAQFEASSAPDLIRALLEVRLSTEAICAPLAVDDFGVQTMPEMSPIKWHLAHTSWFLETFVLAKVQPGRRPFRPEYTYLFNSYYETIGSRQPRPQRGFLSRPTLAEIRAYRRAVDDGLRALPELRGEVSQAALLALHHEQQHQELILTDLKHLLGQNPLRPAYRPERSRPTSDAVSPLRWMKFEEGLRAIGVAAWQGDEPFAFDNESPRHRIFLSTWELAHRPVTVGEYLQFMEDGGYRTPTLWLSDGWSAVQNGAWQAPLYWRESDEGWRIYTLEGERVLAAAEPVCHISYYEADAFARWAGARLPTEAEWEVAAAPQPLQGNLLESGVLHPVALADQPSAQQEADLAQLFGDVWEWTASNYLPYPRFQPFEGEFGEYNGKFMCNQLVLRGGSCFTPRSHLRPSYRNFFPPETRWQMAGLRLARDVP